MRPAKAPGLQTVQNERLDKFLVQEGLLDLLENLVAAAQDDVEALQLRTSAREMILPNGLAASFQVLVQRKSSSPISLRKNNYSQRPESLYVFRPEA